VALHTKVVAFYGAAGLQFEKLAEIVQLSRSLRCMFLIARVEHSHHVDLRLELSTHEHAELESAPRRL
jgi:hypothetical protein